MNRNKFKVGKRVKISREPKFWNSGYGGMCPLNGSINYPAEGFITLIRYNVINIKINKIVYGFDRDVLIENRNIQIINNINNKL